MAQPTWGHGKSRGIVIYRDQRRDIAIAARTHNGTREGGSVLAAIFASFGFREQAYIDAESPRIIRKLARRFDLN